jgi:N-acetylneuraminic acid mutarotase
MHRLLLISLFCASAFLAAAQGWKLDTLSQTMPAEASNNAVVFHEANGGALYSFAGIDGTKLSSGIHLKAYRYDLVGQQWFALPDLPDTLGKIAAAVSAIGCRLYITGGYHVYTNGTEQSSNLLHCYNACSNSYEANGAALPVAIDDHVQAVWRDSLLYCVTGWSNTSNVANVQVYNPAVDAWSQATAVPNNNFYKAFGASGTIVGDTIYYFGGASMGANFPAVNVLRKGIIDPSNPLSIAWTYTTVPNVYSYRSACVHVGDYICWIGGSDKTYNFDGLAYAGGAGVSPAKRSVWYHVPTGVITIDTLNQLPMDLRSAAAVNDSIIYLLGGMESQQVVSSRALRMHKLQVPLYMPQSIATAITLTSTATQGQFILAGMPIGCKVQLYDLLGKLVFSREALSEREIVNVGPTKGAYLLVISHKNLLICSRLVH